MRGAIPVVGGEVGVEKVMVATKEVVVVVIKEEVVTVVEEVVVIRKVLKEAAVVAVIKVVEVHNHKQTSHTEDREKQNAPYLFLAKVNHLL